MKAVFVVLIAAAILGLFVLVARVDWEPAAQIRDCVRSESYTAFVSRAAGMSGMPVGSLRMVTRTRCAEWTPYRDNPAHVEWEARQRAKEWQ